MPSLTSYTPYETLAFCQSVAYHGSDASAFEAIAVALNSNQLIRESKRYDGTRLTAAALQSLYQDLLVEERNVDVPTVNGDNASNPRKRKLSTSPAPAENDVSFDQKFLHSLVDKLYARFRDQTIKEIRQEEEVYAKLQAEIAELEKAEDEQQQQQQVDGQEVKTQRQSPVETPKSREETAPKLPPVPAIPASPDATASPSAVAVEDSRTEQTISNSAPLTSADARASPSSVRSGPQQPVTLSHSPAPTTPGVPSARLSVEPVHARSSQPPGPPQNQSPGAFHRTLPVPSPQRPNYGAINPQHFQPGPQGQPVPVLPPQLPGIPHMPPPTEYLPQKHANSSSGQGRRSPIPMPPQQTYPGYPGYHQHSWPHHMPPQHQYPQPYPNAPYYVQPPASRPPIPYQTPHHSPYQTYPQSAPIHYQQPPPPPGWSNQPYYGYHGSTNVTPIPRSDSRPPLLRLRSSTPWKCRSQVSNGVRQPSPVRPEREVSPLTDTESPSRPSKERKSPSNKDQSTLESGVSKADVPTARGRQAASATPSAFVGSRSQSIASFASDTPVGKRRLGKPQKIKAEPPSTPAPMLSDTEPAVRPSERRRGRPRNGTMTSRNDIPRTTTAVKRKRSPDRESPSPSLPSPACLPSPRQLSHDSSLVTVSKNFTKTSQLLVNDIVSHKLAGIFARPLSERDAPGYKNLVLRSQDLKSIKAAISKGGKAALAAIEAVEGEDRSGEETPTRSATTAGSDAKEGSVGNGMYLVKASEDLVPPKGIVNSSQLEMELVRMFANAVMFNPLPTSERGFGRSLRLRRNGGDIDPSRDLDAEYASSSEEGTTLDEGGIISDTREMFEDVLASVHKWRDVELERLRGVGDETPATGLKVPQAQSGAMTHGTVSANASVRHSSVGSAVNEEDGAGERTPVPASASITGTARKRRRIAEN